LRCRAVWLEDVLGAADSERLERISLSSQLKLKVAHESARERRSAYRKLREHSLMASRQAQCQLPEQVRRKKHGERQRRAFSSFPGLIAFSTKCAEVVRRRNIKTKYFRRNDLCSHQVNRKERHEPDREEEKKGEEEVHAALEAVRARVARVRDASSEARFAHRTLCGMDATVRVAVTLLSRPGTSIGGERECRTAVYTAGMCSEETGSEHNIFKPSPTTMVD